MQGCRGFCITSFVVKQFKFCCEIFQWFSAAFELDIVPEPKLALFGCSESLFFVSGSFFSVFFSFLFFFFFFLFYDCF